MSTIQTTLPNMSKLELISRIAELRPDHYAIHIQTPEDMQHGYVRSITELVGFVRREPSEYSKRKHDQHDTYLDINNSSRPVEQIGDHLSTDEYRDFMSVKIPELLLYMAQQNSEHDPLEIINGAFSWGQTHPKQDPNRQYEHRAIAIIGDGFETKSYMYPSGYRSHSPALERKLARILRPLPQ